MGFFSKKVINNKANDANDFMSMMGSAKKEVQANLETKIESFELSFQDAVKLLGEFAGSKDPKKLKSAAKEFLKLVQSKPSRVESYVYLAYIMFLYGNKEEAVQYIKLAESIDPDYKFITKIKSCIYTKSNS